MTEWQPPVPERDDRPVGHELVGAYVLDALGLEQRRAFERHLGGCALCRRDVREFRETLSGMKRLIASPPPDALRDSVLDAIRDLPQLPPDNPRN